MRNNHSEIIVEGMPSGSQLILGTGKITTRTDNIPSIEIILAELPQGWSLNKRPSDNPFSNLFSKSYSIGASFIPLLRIGSVFFNGRRTGKTIFDEFYIDVIDPSSCKVIKPKDFFTNDSCKLIKASYTSAAFSNWLLLPKEKFGFTEIKGQELIEVDHVLIPCYEIARFYFLRSDNLVKSILKNPSCKAIDFLNIEESDFLTLKNKNKVQTVILNSNMLFDDGPIIYRMFFDEFATKQYTYLRNMLTSDFFTNNGFGSIFCKIPYDDKIEMKVSGRIFDLELSTGIKSKVLLAYQILSQENQWDVDKFEFLKEVKTKKTSKTDGSIEKQYKVPQPGKEVRITDLVGHDYNSFNKKFIVSDEEESENFKGLKAKTGYLEKIEEQIKTDDSKQFYTTYSIGETSSFSNLDKTEKGDLKLPYASFTTNEAEKEKYLRANEEALDNILLEFKKALELCKQEHHINFRYCILREADMPDSTLFPSKGKVEMKEDEWKWRHCLYDRKIRDWVNERKVILAEINYRGNFCYILRVRPKYSAKEISLRILVTKNNQQITEYLPSIMNQMAEDYGGLAGFEEEEESQRKGYFSHVLRKMHRCRISPNTPLSKYSNKLFKKIVEVLAIYP